MKTIALQLSGVILGALIVGAFALSHFAGANGPFTTPAYEANVSGLVQVTPASVQTLASSSRAYVHFQSATTSISVYCNADGDVPASLGVASFVLATNTPTFEIHIEKGGYDGAVRCYAPATTSIYVWELKRR